jgi:hypothetical protein
MDEGMIERGIYDFKYPEKADTFSLGITMLEVATLENCAYLYIRNPLRISFEKLTMYKNILKHKYSAKLSKIVDMALDSDHRNRVTISQIY